MTKLEKILLSLAITTSVFLLFFISNYPPKQVEGSVSQGSDYIATTTRNFVGLPMQNGSILNTGSGTLGSVVITGASGAGAGIINIYDATSTITNSQTGTTTLATFPAQTAAGTYTFDVRYVRGLVIEIIGAVGTSTITYR